ncbi:hypothetical protein PD653_5020 [Nocardioides sp. PD653]|nr:hypothetical protein PD653B2_2933 [Nocardioides sp. PD653-B2]GAW57575.1 hypothetical protein PD653_5020 [Nocardioides sp. PD653]
MLISTDAIDQVTAVLYPSDYYRPAHEQIHDAIVDLHHRGDPVDMVTVAAELARHTDHRGRTRLEQVGGHAYLHTLAAEVPIAANATHYANLVRDKARLRALVDDGTKLVQLGYAGDLDKAERFLGDAVDHITETAMRFGATTTSSTGFRDLSWILTGQAPVIPPPVWVHHEAGHGLFYDGKVNGVFGDPETAKTWLAQCAIVEALNAGGTAAMVDVDHNGENHTAARLLLLGARPEHLANPEKFRYYDPQDGDQLRHDITEITTRRPNVVLIDSLGEIFPMLGLNTNDGDEITGGLRLISKPADVGSCVIFIDHLPKSTEARATGFAIGSIAKKRAIRGSYIRAEESTKPAPGQVGKINLFIEKDTSGELRRAVPGGKYLGKFVLDSTQPHITTWKVVRDDAPTGPSGQKRYTRVMERISRFVEDNDQCTGRDIREAIGGRPEIVAKALKTLLDEDFISVHKGAGRSHRHHAIAQYREAEDDNAQPDD